MERKENLLMNEVLAATQSATAVAGSSAPPRSYCLITPARDEAQYARRTLESIVRQSVLPSLWVIVDDGSKDETPEILKEYAEKYEWIRVIKRVDRGTRKLGGGVIDAFYAGYETINPKEYSYVCKLDLDLDIPPRYFETLMQRMEQDPRIGTCSGKPYMDLNGRLVSEMLGDENSVGMIKFYRTDCFEEIGGFVRYLMWDGIDGHRCRMLGWVAISWDEPEIRFVHLRPMGTSDKSWWTGRVRHGVGQYYMGTTPVYMLLSGLFRMSRPPLILGGVAMLWGYVKSTLQRGERYEDSMFRAFLRRYQWACMLKGKSRATSVLNDKQAAVWQSAHVKHNSVDGLPGEA